MGKWKIVSEKTVLKAKLFKVKELKIKLENGADRTHHIAERLPTVSVFPITENFEVYLVSQYRYMLKKRTLEAMAGFIEPGETSLSAAKRELKEETGLVATQWEELARIEMAGSVFRAVSNIFLAKDLSQETSNPEEEEKITVLKLPLEEAVKKVLAGEINHSASMIGILLLDKLKKEKKL